MSQARAVRRALAGDGRRWVVLGILALSAAGLSLLVQHHVVPLHSNNRDEGVYLFQARMFREGMLTLPAAEHGEFFRPWLSGERDGRIFLQYQLGFPAFLAAAEWLLGSFRAVLALVAGLTVVAVDGFARLLLRDRTTALVAAGLVALSPLMVLHSALVLSYGLAVLLLCAAAWAVLSAVDRRSWRIALLAGCLAGAATTVRPFDVVLMLTPVGVLALVRLLRESTPGFRTAATMAAALAAGFVPFLAALAWYNTRTTGSVLQFPNMAADPLNRFGFGTRRLVETEPTISYSPSDALDALWTNVQAVPSWLLGGVLALVAAAVGLLRRGRGPERAVLAAVTLAFPAGYFFWWATRLSAETVTNGIGPHYYIPAFVTLGILAARGLVTSVPRRPVVVGAVVVGLAIPTAWALPDKFERQRLDTSRATRIEALVPDDLEDAVVVVDYLDRPYLLSEFTFHRPDPTLRAEVLYAAERGPLTFGLVDRYPDRTLYRLRGQMQPGDDLFQPTGSFDRLGVVSGPELTVAVAPEDLPPRPYARHFVTVGGRTHHLAAPAVPTDRLAATTWRLAPDDRAAGDGVVPIGEGAAVTIGIEYSQTPDFEPAERVEIEFAAEPVGDDGLRILVPGRGWLHVDFPTGLARLAYDATTMVDVDVRSASG